MNSLQNSNNNKILNNNKNSNQFFKTFIPIFIIYDFFKINCIHDHNNLNTFVFNKEAYKRSKLNNSLSTFLEDISTYYHTSKLKYIHNCNNYKKLLTIIRQVCKYHNIEYTNKIQYFTSNYESQYTIIFHDFHLKLIHKYYCNNNDNDNDNNDNDNDNDSISSYNTITPVYD
jgi:hypothetical protein